MGQKAEKGGKLEEVGWVIKPQVLKHFPDAGEGKRGSSKGDDRRRQVEKGEGARVIERNDPKK